MVVMCVCRGVGGLGLVGLGEGNRGVLLPHDRGTIKSLRCASECHQELIRL